MNTSDKIKAVIIGFAHMHVNEVADYIKSEDSFDLCAAADSVISTAEIPKTIYTRAWNRENIRQNFCSNIYSDYRVMLDEVKPEIAFILSETSKKPEIVEECALRGVNVSIEKPMAMSYDDALKIKSSIDKSKIFAMVNYPLTWRPYLYKIKEIINSGTVGKMIKLRFLIGNTGPVGIGAMHRGVSEKAGCMTDREKASMWWYNKSEGGGALLDFCCYGCMLSQWFTGETAEFVSSTAVNSATRFADIYDNAVTVIKYPSSVSVLEGTWTSPSRAIPAGPTVFCDEGVIECRRENGVIVPFAYDIYGNDIDIGKFDNTLPPQFKNIAAMYAHHVKTGEPVHDTLRIENNLKVTALLDAASRSAESGRRESIRKDGTV